MSWNHIHLLQHLNTGCQYSGKGQTVFWVPEKTLKTTPTWINSAHFLSWPFSYNFIFPRIASRIILLLSTPYGNIPSFLELWPRWLTLLQKSGGSLWSSVLKLRVDTFPGPSSTHCSDSRPWPFFLYCNYINANGAFKQYHYHRSFLTLIPYTDLTKFCNLYFEIMNCDTKNRSLNILPP